MKNNTEDFNKVIDKFEPMPHFEMDFDDAKNLINSAICSIAISLKRIADKLELANKQPIMSAEEYAKYEEAKERKEHK